MTKKDVYFMMNGHGAWVPEYCAANKVLMHTKSRQGHFLIASTPVHKTIHGIHSPCSPLIYGIKQCFEASPGSAALGLKWRINCSKGLWRLIHCKHEKPLSREREDHAYYEM